MKIQIRKGVFETNSSSTHSVVIMSTDDFKKWEAGEVLIKSDDVYVGKTIKECFTKEEALSIWESMEYKSDRLEGDFMDKEYYDENGYEFEEVTTPDGKWVIYSSTQEC